MKIQILAVGTRMAAWVEQGCAEYLKRMPRDMPVTIREIPLARGQKSADPEKLKRLEAAQLLARITPQDLVVALEVQGKPWTTPDLARQMENWRMSGRDVQLLVGGPDGLAESCRKRANSQWSLSPLTLPHPLVRVVLAEQLYRAWSILQGHPYHRG